MVTRPMEQEAMFPEQASADADADAKAKAKHDGQRLREADYTPRGVARALVASMMRSTAVGSQLRQAIKLYGVVRGLDAFAGGGVWGQELARAIEGEVQLTAVELDPGAEANLARTHQRVEIVDWREHVAACEHRDGFDGFDIIITNPSFTLARAPDCDKCPDGYDVERSLVASYLRLGSVVAVYNTQQAWTKTKGGYLVRKAYPPAYMIDVPGAVKHRVGRNDKGETYSSDSVPYTLTIWVAGIRGSAETFMLDPLSAEDRKFIPRVIKPKASCPDHWYLPGTEPDEMLREWGVPLVSEAP